MSKKIHAWKRDFWASKKKLSERRIEVYGARNRVLRSLGFNSYQEYLNSSLWKEIRAKVLETNRYCYACARPATQVHHQKYFLKDLNGERLRNLVALCAKCHHFIEFRRDGEKITPFGANRILRKLSRWRKQCRNQGM